MSQLISNLAVGAKIKYGSYKVESSTTLPIIWQVIDKNHTGYPANSVTLLADKIIDLRGLDAKEPLNADANRITKGNGRYRTSNLRQWLNSSAAANAWWVAQNLTDGTANTNNNDATPNDAGMSQPTGYSDIKGFLNNFTAQELAKILDTTLTVAKNIVTDGGTSETVIDKVFLLSNTEVGFANENNIAEGSLFSIFAANANRVAYMTAQGFSNTLSGQKPVNVSTAWQWWLRTPYTSNSYQTRLVLAAGTLDFYSAYYAHFGVRPALNLASDILVSDAVDIDGCYIVDANTNAKSTVSVSSPANINLGSTVNVSSGNANINLGSTVTIKNAVNTPAKSTVNLTGDASVQLNSMVNINFLWLPILYVFSAGEQLQTILINNGAACPFYNAVHNELINRENTFTFEIPADHVDAQYVTEGSLIAFQDIDSNWQLFEVKRIIDIDDTTTTKQIYCDHAFYELLGDIVPSGGGTSAWLAVASALSQSRWEVGAIADLGLETTSFSYQTALECLQQVAATWKGELQFRIVLYNNQIVRRYVDLVAQRGSDTGKQFVFGKDLEKVEREIDLTGLCTAMYGRGKATTSGERLNFASINAGKEYVADAAALAQYGLAGGTRHRFGIFDDSQEVDTTFLLAKTQAALQLVKVPVATYTFQVVLLEQLSPDYSHEAVRMGDIVTTIDDNFVPALQLSERVIQIQWNLLEYDKTVITLGSFLKDLADVQVAQNQVNQQMLDQTTETQDMSMFNLLFNSRADDGFNYWINQGFDIDNTAGVSGSSAFVANGAVGIEKSIIQTVDVANRAAYVISAQVEFTDIVKGATGQMGFEITFEYQDGTIETQFLAMG